MKPFSKRFAWLALVAGVLALSSAAVAEGWFSDMDDAKEVTLGDILRDPQAYLDTPVIVKVYFNREGSDFNPYFTRYHKLAYGNFSAWPLNARLYEKRDFERPYPLFYMDKTDSDWDNLSSLDRVTPIEIEGVVHHVFRGQPCIEVFDYHRLGEGMRYDNVRLVVTGDAYFDAGRYEDAERAYDRADSSRLSDADRAVIYRKLGDARFAQGEYRDALRAYEGATRYTSDSRVLEQNINACNDRLQRARSNATAQDRAGVPLKASPLTRHVLPDTSNDVDEIVRVFEAARQEEAEQPAAPVQPVPVTVSAAAEEEPVVEETTQVEAAAAPEDEPVPAEEEVAPEVTEEPAQADEAGTVEEQPAEETAEETVEEVAEETVEELPAEGTAEETVEEVAEETVEELPAEEPAEETVEEVTEQAVEGQPAEETVQEVEIVPPTSDEPVRVEVAGHEATPKAATARLPRLPFFGCDEVTMEQLQAILEEISRTPGG